MTQKEELLEEIMFMKKTAPEELFRISLDSIILYFKSLIKFGIDSKESKESINVLLEMSHILKEEKRLLNLIKKNIETIDLDEASEIIDQLDILNETTYLSYDDILNEIEISCESNLKNRTLKPRNGINSLITNDEYRNKVYKLIKKDD